MTKKAEKGIRKTIYRHPVGALRVFCGVMLLTLLGICGYAGSARTKNVQSAVSLPVIRTELEGDAVGGGSIAEVRARLNRQREEELALLNACDVLIDGPFLQAERSLELRWRGSRNQRIIDLNATRRSGRGVLWESNTTSGRK